MVAEDPDSRPGGRGRAKVAGSCPVGVRWSRLVSDHRADGGSALVGGCRMKDTVSTPTFGTRVTFMGTRVTFTGTRVTFH